MIMNKMFISYGKNPKVFNSYCGGGGGLAAIDQPKQI